MATKKNFTTEEKLAILSEPQSSCTTLELLSTRKMVTGYAKKCERRGVKHSSYSILLISCFPLLPT
jgi:hypothetical protein